MTENYPAELRSDAELDETLSLPTNQLVGFMKRIPGDIMILGIAGKMGITLGLAARRAIDAAGVKKEVIGVSRFSDPDSRVLLEGHGIKTLACDLLDRASVAQLPLIPNIIYMAGRKFGTDGSEALTWIMNTEVPANVCNHFTGNNIVAFSTGCVYPLLPLGQIGCTEENSPAPVGEYAQSCLGRERVFQYYSRAGKIKSLLFRLNYAIDLRYGVLHDLAIKIMNDEPVDLGMGYFNAIWQGDANVQALLSLEHCASPAAILNITGPETVSVRYAAAELARVMEKDVSFVGEPVDKSYLNNAARAAALFGYPRVSLLQMIRWTGLWVKNGHRSLGKPTHFEVNDGKF